MLKSAQGGLMSKDKQKKDDQNQNLNNGNRSSEDNCYGHGKSKKPKLHSGGYQEHQPLNPDEAQQEGGQAPMDKDYQTSDKTGLKQKSEKTEDQNSAKDQKDQYLQHNMPEPKKSIEQDGIKKDRKKK